MPFYDIDKQAYTISFFFFALVETLLCSGITYGWASIVVVFKVEHFFLYLCNDWYEARNWTMPEDVEKVYFPKRYSEWIGFNRTEILLGCPSQDTRFNLVLTISLFAVCAVKFPAGILIDYCGPRIARNVGGFMYILACIGLAMIGIGYENWFFAVFILIGMGGSLLVVSVYQVSNIVFREASSRVMCILAGAFDSSAVVLLLLKLIYEAGISLHVIAIGYGIICLVLIGVGTFFLIPPLNTLFAWAELELLSGRQTTLSVLGPDFTVNSLTKSLQRSYNRIDNRDKMVYHQKEKYGSMDLDKKTGDIDQAVIAEEEEEEILFDKSEEIALLQQKSDHKREDNVLVSALSPLYLLELLFLMTIQLKLWHFVGSLDDYLGRLALNDRYTVSWYVNMFGYIQFCGVIITPIVGIIFDKESFFGQVTPMPAEERRLKKLSESVLPFVITSILAIAFCALSLIPHLYAQIPAFVLYTAVRGFLYANHGAFMGLAFPATQFGTLYGLGIFIGGGFSCLQYPLFQFSSIYMNGDPYWANIILLVLVTTGLLHPFHVWWYCKKEYRKQAQNKLYQGSGGNGAVKNLSQGLAS